MIIDSHLHVWDRARALYPWLTPEAGPLYRSYGFEEIAGSLAERNIEGAVLVQASDEAADTAIMRDVAAQHSAILGIVAWTPLDNPTQLAADLDQFSDDPLIVGIRNLVHERPPAWLDQAVVGEGLAILAARGMPLDFPTANHTGLAALADLGRRHADLPIVIDHLGKPPINGSADDRAHWRQLIAECARNPRTVAKISGLYASHGPLDSWTVDGIRPFVEDALELFTPARLMYGGDWPIAELAGGYGRSWDAIAEVLTSLGEPEREAIFGGTAARVYSLDLSN